MNKSPDLDPLDSLLATPAVISDRGFSERTRIELNKAATRRYKIFVATGLCWLLLALIVITPQSLMENLAALGRIINFSEPIALLTVELNSIDYSLLQTNLLSMTVVGLSLVAVFSLMLRSQ